MDDIDHLLNNTIEIGGSTQANVMQGLTIEVKNALSAKDLWVSKVAIQWETMLGAV